MFEEILEYYNISIEQRRRHGDVMCFCPIHQGDSIPSMCVNLETDVFVCFSSRCEAKGDAIEFVRIMDDLRSRTEARKFIEQNIVEKYSVDRLQKDWDRTRKRIERKAQDDFLSEKDRIFEIINKRLVNVFKNDYIMKVYEEWQEGMRKLGKIPLSPIMEAHRQYVWYLADYWYAKVDSAYELILDRNKLISFYQYALRNLKEMESRCLFVK